MFLSKKRYVRVKDDDYGWDRKKESNARYATKNIIALGATASLAYLSSKYGLDSTLYLTSHTFNFDSTVPQTVQDGVEKLFVVGGVGVLGGVFLGLFSEMAAMSFRNYDGNGTIFKRVLLAAPVAAIAFGLHETPEAMSVAMESAKHILYSGASLSVAALSVASIMSPLFFSSIANYVDEKLETAELPAFRKMTNKISHYFSEMKKERTHKKNLHQLEKSEEQFNQSDNKTNLNSAISSQFGTLRNTLNEAISRYQIERQDSSSTREVRNYLDKLLNHSLFILDNQKDVLALTAKQEVISLVNSTLPQLVLSFYRSLNNQNSDAIVENTHKLVGALKTTHEHFDEIVGQIKDNQIQTNNMDFDQAVAFTQTRFAKKDTLNVDAPKKMNMGA